MNIHSRNVLSLLHTADLLRNRIQGEFSAIHGLSVSEFIMLLHLEKADLLRLSRVELAKRMNVSASTITRMTAPMEKLGLLDRQQDKRDARLAFVLITDAGLEKLKDARVTFEKKAKQIFQQQWTEEEVQSFSAFMYRLATYNSDATPWRAD